MPIVRSPCTFEWPRTGNRPAPGLPTMPCRNATFTNSLIVLTALWCWVMPIAQQLTVRFEAAIMSAASRISSIARPVAARTSSQSTERTCCSHSAKPTVCCSMKSRSTTVPGAASSASSRRRPRPW